MLALLSQLSPRELRSAIGSETIRRLDGLVETGSGDQNNPSSLVLGHYLLALHGTDVLNNERIRRLVFKLLQPEHLQVLAEQYTGRSFSKPYDNAILLSGLPWRSGSRLVEDVATALEIPKEYLPSPSVPAPTLQTLEPSPPLPPLHPYQDEVMKEVVRFLRAKVPAFLVQMPTGAGKTRTVVDALVSHIQDVDLFHHARSVIWLAHSEELCEQAIETIARVWATKASTPADLLRCFGSHGPDPSEVRGSFVVGTFQKLSSLANAANNDLFPSLQRSSAIVVVDEAHRVLAPTFATVTKALLSGHAVLIGLTATPGRGRDVQQENEQLARLFAKHLVTAKLGPNPIRTLREMGVLSATKHRTIESGVDVHLSREQEQCVERDWDLPDSILKRLGNHRERNRRVLDVTIEHLSRERPTIIFCCSVEHSKILAAALTLRGYPCGQIDGTMHRTFRRKVIDDFRAGRTHALTNFGVLSTGFDAPRIRCVVITRPTASIVLYSQMVGRGLRGPRMGGGEECDLIDIRDNFVNFGNIDSVYSFFDHYWTSGD